MEPVIEAILNVLTIIALIAAVAFIIILLVDLVLSITNRKGSIFFRGRNSEKDDTIRPVVKNNDENENFVRPTVLQQEQQPEQNVEQPKLTWNEEEAQREQIEILNKRVTLDEEDELLLAKEKDLENERLQSIERKKQEFDDFDDFDSLFDEPDEISAPVEEEFDFDDMINEINSESVTKYEANKQEEVVETVVEEQPVEAEPFVIEEIEEVKTDEVVEVKEESIAQTETVITPVIAETEEPKKVIVNVYEYFPLEALEERLAKLQERLKVNERDLKGNRKEYTPLARVQRNLKRDQEKLRRREAVIARKKVMLYGVNNYVDIDEEKAKKLSEDLDLLDGLRLSVQHCEEVMEQNKDRFPILEKTNQILTEQNKHLKEDIAEVKAAIERLNNETVTE
ncbi:MAG: hypothetical protein J6C13_00085 [Clostridia bacterium]|nr:hypothetical protein [Clostridia bacterium]